MQNNKAPELSKGADSKNSRLEARITPGLKNLLVKAAKIQGISLTDFVITTAKKEAESVLKSQALINLSLRDMSLLIEHYASDLEPNSKLKQASIRFKSAKSN